MTNTYNTGNPLGSTDPRDLYDNASNFDDGMNTTSPSFEDRKGVLRKTWKGMEVEFNLAQSGRQADFLQFLDDSSFVPLGNYTAGMNFTLYNQYMARGGFFYRPAASSIPFTTTGTWTGADENLFALFSTDDVLRQDISDDTDPVKGAAIVGRSAQFVSSIAGLRLLDKTAASKNAFVTGYSSAGDGGGGVYWMDSSDTTSADNGGTVIVAADGGRWKLAIQTPYVSVKQFGATGDGATDDSAAINACVAYCQTVGGKVFLPRGSYLCFSAIVVNESSLTSESDLTRVSLEGEGSGNTQILCANASQGVAYLGGTLGGLSSYFEMKNIRLQGAGLGVCDGLVLDNCAFAHFEDVVITGFATGYGVRATDLLSTLFDSCEIRGNKYGFFCERVDQSYPNAITLVATDIGVNSEFGAYFKQPTNLSITGGSIQGNGLGGVSGTKWGIKVDSGGGEGAAALSVKGVYFELNVGSADLFIEHVSNNCTYVVDGCTFNRIDATNFVTNNIRMDIGGGTAQLVTSGCGFKGFNTYAANSSRRYIAVNSGGGLWNFFDTGNIYVNAVEKPVISGHIRNTQAPASAYIRFNGISGAAAQSFNATVIKNAVGDYTVTYGRPLASAGNTYSFSLATAGFVEVFSESTTTIRVLTKNTALALTDFGLVCVTVHGGADTL